MARPGFDFKQCFAPNSAAQHRHADASARRGLL